MVQTVSGPQTVFVDQSIQPGAGGYGISLGMQAFQRVKRAILYVSGNYLVTPQESNGTPNASLAGVPRKPNLLTATMSIPDQYLVDGGVAYPVPKMRGWRPRWDSDMRESKYATFSAAAWGSDGRDTRFRLNQASNMNVAGTHGR
jgi:hypothetical protein